MKVLMIGDVVGKPGCEFLRERLPSLKKELSCDVVIVNGENSAVGNGMLPSSVDHLLDSGADIITSGNHAFKRREIYSYFDEHDQVIRPANFPGGAPGKGYYVYDGGSFSLLVVNMLGTSYLEPLDNPFYAVDKILNEVKATYTIIDFHAEATGEKRAFGYYLDGRVSAVCGTHTHVQTADEQILPKGTGYITDLGMTGPITSVLGVKCEAAISRFCTQLPTRFEVPSDVPCKLNGVLLTLSKETGLCEKIVRLQIQ